MSNKQIKVNCIDLKKLPFSYETNIIEIYWFRQSDFYHVLEKLTKFISLDELNRAKKFRFEGDYKNYIVCHGILRLILSKKTGNKPNELEIVKDIYNKPFLKNSNLLFNLSHTKELCAFAISDNGQLGIDIEKIKEKKSYLDITKKYFSRSEQEIIDQSELPINMFYLIWTRKEAFLKAIGSGIRLNLNCIDVGKTTNKIDQRHFEQLKNISLKNEYYIYSCTLLDHELSVTSNLTSKVELKNLNSSII